MNILMMPDYRGGNPYQTLLANALNHQGLNVFFCVGYRRVFPIYRQVKQGLESVDVLHLHWLDPYLKGNSYLYKLIYCLKFLLDIWLVKRQNIRIVWTIHNLASHNTKFPRLERFVKQRFLSFVDCVIVHSQSAKDAVLQTYRFEVANVTVIPHGHYRDVYRGAIAKQEARQKLNLPHDKLLFLNFGMLKPYKGIEKVIDIWHSNAEIANNNCFLITGKAVDKTYGQVLKTAVNNTEGIELRDEFVADEKVHLYFSAADVVVLPFDQILTSGSLLLAVSYGKPVIAPKLANIEETLGQATTFLYNPLEDNALFEAIRASISADLITESKKVVAAGDRLNWHDIASETKIAYQI